MTRHESAGLERGTTPGKKRFRISDLRRELGTAGGTACRRLDNGCCRARAGGVVAAEPHLLEPLGLPDEEEEPDAAKGTKDLGAVAEQLEDAACLMQQADPRAEAFPY